MNDKSASNIVTSGLDRRTLLATLGAAAFTPAMPYLARAQAETIRIGFPVPLTGAFGAEAQDQVRCAQLAVEQFNAAGGVGGRMAELLVRDDKLNPGEATTRTLELIEKDKVNFVVGALAGNVQLAVNEVCKTRGVIYVSISQSDTINEAGTFSRFTFHEGMTPHMTTAAVAKHVFPKAAGKRVAYLVADYTYGHEGLRAFKRNGEQFGMQTVEEILHPLGTQDFSTFFPRILAAKPDVVCICNFGRDQLNSIKQAVDFGIKKQAKIAVPVFLYAQRRAGSPAMFEGVAGGCNYHWTLEDTIDSAKKFNTAYRAKYNNTVPSDYGAYGYAGLSSLLAAVKAAGKTDTDAVIAAFEQVKLDTHKGPEYYRKCDHQAVQPVFVVESKPQAQMKNEFDVFNIVSVEQGAEANLRTCQELGHKS
ncbi:MAG: ABC transporter substrate-binding protein [Beijerinckiaceae bacterium]